MQPISYQSPEEFLTDPRFKRTHDNGMFRFTMSRMIVFGFLVSLIVHILIFFISLPEMEVAQSGRMKSGPLQISLAAPEVVTPQVEVVPPPPAPPEPPKPKKPKPKIKPKNKTKVMTQVVKPKPPVFSVPEEISEPVEEVITPKPLALDVKPEPKPNLTEPPTDMMAMIKQKRAARIAQGDAAEINAQAIREATGPSEAEQREARIKENMKSGTNGVFQVTSLRSYEATFLFRGWTGDYSNARSQYFQVTATGGQDIRLVMIRRMIKLIRTHYQGDFSWQSHRLNQSVTLSARLSDTAGLEEFLMREFFGENYNR